MAGVKYPDWQESYVAAISESDRGKLVRRIHLAEFAITLRLQALSTSLNGHAERRAILDALNGLLAVKTEMLRFPAWSPPDGSPKLAPIPEEL